MYSNLLKSFLIQFNNGDDYFLDKNKFFAHRRVDIGFPKETLYQHSLNTLLISDILLEKTDYLLFKQIDKNVKEKYKGNISDYDIKHFSNLFFLAMFLHDYGKHNYNFQTEKMDNTIKGSLHNLFPKNIQTSNHSEYNLFMEIIKEKFNVESTIIQNGNGIGTLRPKPGTQSIENNLKTFNVKILDQFSLLLLNCINKHHSGLNNLSNSELKSSPDLNDFLYLFDNNLLFIQDLLYSFMIQSDSLATEYYMEEQKTDIKSLNIDELRNELNIFLDRKFKKINIKELKSIESKKDYNKSIYEKLKNKNVDLDLNNIVDLNDLKEKTSLNIIDEIRNNELKDINLIELKTGLGKTNISMLCFKEILEKNPTIEKVIYALPLNILINQTNEAINDAFDFKNNTVSILNQYTRADLEQSKVDTSNYWANKYDFDNFNSEIILSSGVNFFSKLFGKKKQLISSMINLRNSIIIIDELQLYNDKFFKLMYRYMTLLNDYLNVKFIILSATLPIPLEYKLKENVNIILNEEKRNLINNNSELERYKYDLSLLHSKKDGKNLIDNTIEEMANIINNTKLNNILIVSNNITKSNDLFNKLNPKLSKEITCLFYNNTILKSKLNEILNKIKNNTDKKFVLFSTCKIETGVDISFDLGFRFEATIDNMIQFAGRINRYGLLKDENQNKMLGNIYIINDNIFIKGNVQQRDIIAFNNSGNKMHYNDYLKDINRYYELLFKENNKNHELDIYLKHDLEKMNNLKIIDENYIQYNFFVNINLDTEELNLEKYKEIINKYHYKNSIDIFKNMTKIYKNKKETIIKKEFEDKELNKLFEEFTFKAYVKKDSDFFRTMSGLHKEFVFINKEKSEQDVFFHVISESYDLNKGLDNKNITGAELEDLINSL